MTTNKLVIDNIQSLLDAQFQRLSSLEISLMYWLAIYREPATIEELKTDDLARLSTQKIISALDSLRDRSLLQVKDNCYTLQNVVMEYVSELIINKAVEEIDREDLELLDTHCIIQATAPDYIRIYQYQVLISPILDAFSKLPQKEIASRLLRIIAKLRHTNSDLKYGYAPGNIINFFWIWSLKFTQKDNLDLLISTSSDNTARVWNLDTGKTVYTYDKLPELAGVVWSVAFSPDGETFASGSATKV